MSKIKFSIIAPVYNSQNTISEFIERIMKSISQFSSNYELILIDDKSSDNSVSEILNEMKKYQNIKLIKLKQNFGQSNAITAGLCESSGEFITVMDSDLQDKPEDIITLFTEMEKKNCDMILSARLVTNNCNRRNTLSKLFYYLSNGLTKIKHPPNTGVFRIMKRKCLNGLLKEPFPNGTTLSNILLKKEINWQILNLERDVRKENVTGYNLKKLINLALSRILVFSKVPIQNIGYISIIFGTVLIWNFVENRNMWLIIPIILFFILGIMLSDRKILEKYKPKYEIEEIIE